MSVEDRIRPIDADSLRQAREIVADGGLVVVPTDTVYGLACDPFDPEAIAAVFAAKRRPKAKSLQVLLPGLSLLPQLGLTLQPALGKLAAALLPGGFSPIADAGTDCRLATLRREEGDDGRLRLTQAIRVPASEPLSRILAVTGALAATSANISGQPSATSAQQAAQALGESVGLYLDAGPTPGPVASTVVGPDPGDPDGIAVLREGVIPTSRLRDILRAGTH